MTAGPQADHPHADRRNWQPARTIDEYLQNCREGIEDYSERHVAKLLGVPRISLWRMKLLAQLPEGLFERLIKEGCATSTKQLAQIVQFLSMPELDWDANVAEEVCCPHCGGLIRRRLKANKKVLETVREWVREQNPGGAPK